MKQNLPIIFIFPLGFALLNFMTIHRKHNITTTSQKFDKYDSKGGAQFKNKFLEISLSPEKALKSA